MVAHVGIVAMLEDQFWTATEWPVTVATPLTKMVLVAKVVMDFCGCATYMCELGETWRGAGSQLTILTVVAVPTRAVPAASHSP